MEEEKIVALSAEVAGLEGELKLEKMFQIRQRIATRKIKSKRRRKVRIKQRTRSQSRTRKGKTRMRLGRKSHQVLTILKRRWSTRSLTIGASTTWPGLFTNLRTVDLTRTV